MSSIIGILFTIGFIYLIIWVIKAIIRSATNAPTWEGIIISALLGMLHYTWYFAILVLWVRDGIAFEN